MVAMGQVLGGKLAKTLGLPKYTRAFTLRFEVGKVVTVECEYFPEPIDGELIAVLEQYELHNRPEPRVSEIGYDAWLKQRNEAAHRKMMAALPRLAEIDRKIAAVNQAREHGNRR